MHSSTGFSSELCIKPFFVRTCDTDFAWACCFSCLSTVSYIHWRGVPQGPGRGRRPRPGSLRYTPTVNVGKLFSHAPRMAQITAAVTAAAAAAVVSFRYFPPGREIPGLNFPARRLARKYRQIHPGRWPSFCMQIVTWHGRKKKSVFRSPSIACFTLARILAPSAFYNCASRSVDSIEYIFRRVFWSRSMIRFSSSRSFSNHSSSGHFRLLLQHAVFLNYLFYFCLSDIPSLSYFHTGLRFLPFLPCVRHHDFQRLFFQYVDVAFPVPWASGGVLYRKGQRHWLVVRQGTGHDVASLCCVRQRVWNHPVIDPTRHCSIFVSPSKLLKTRILLPPYIHQSIPGRVVLQCFSSAVWRVARQFI